MHCMELGCFGGGGGVPWCSGGPWRGLCVGAHCVGLGCMEGVPWCSNGVGVRGGVARCGNGVRVHWGRWGGVL